MRSTVIALACLTAMPTPTRGARTPDLSIASDAINALGIELLSRQASVEDNALLSPYSIQCALAMTYAGAAGRTRDEMKEALHYPDDEAGLHASFSGLRAAFAAITEETSVEIDRMKSERFVHRAEKSDSAGTPLELVLANRLFGQDGYDFRPEFLAVLDRQYLSPIERVDFIGRPADARRLVNGWVEERTRKRILNLVPEGGIDPLTRLVLVNAIYLKASWVGGFATSATRPRPFRLGSGETIEVPTMHAAGRFGYEKRKGYSVVRVPYTGEKIHLLVLMPGDPGGLAELEASLTPEILRGASALDETPIILDLPRFRIDPPLLELGATLRSLGMRTAFDEPRGSADFDRMAAHRDGDYLCISEVYHKTFLNLDERGTEAAAATAVAIMLGAAASPPPPEEVRIDRPFLFAIQHRPSGACLFLGRINDPRLQ